MVLRDEIAFFAWKKSVTGNLPLTVAAYWDLALYSVLFLLTLVAIGYQLQRPQVLYHPDYSSAATQALYDGSLYSKVTYLLLIIVVVLLSLSSPAVKKLQLALMLLNSVIVMLILGFDIYSAKCFFFIPSCVVWCSLSIVVGILALLLTANNAFLLSYSVEKLRFSNIVAFRE